MHDNSITMKYFFLITFFFLFGLNLNSQIYLGWNIGGNNSKVRFDDNSYNESFKYIGKPKFGYNAGITNYFYFSKALDLKTEILYTTKGFKYEQSYYFGHKTFNYGQLNLSGQMDLNPYSDVIVAPYIGSYVGYWIWGVATQTDLKLGTTETDNIYLKNDSTFAYNRYDSGLSAGVDFKFVQDNKRFVVLGLKYEFGMVTTDIEKVAGWKNRNISIHFQYFYRFKR